MAKLLLPVLFICISVIGVVAAADVLTERPGCQTRCGDLDIPFPFGIGDQCAIHHGFTINCKNINGTSMAFKGDFEVTKISVPDAKAWMKMNISWQCYNHFSGKMNEWVVLQNFTYTPFRFSYTDNKIFVIGCNTMAYMRGCCEVDVPQDLGFLDAYFNKNYNTSEISYSNCGYVVIMEKAAFSYSTTYIPSTNFWNDYGGRVPAVMDWIITWETCEEAKSNMSSYACVSDNSKCLNSTNGRGYRCKCSNGFDGNPYIKDGCKDINECHDNTTYPCAGICENTLGSYNCSCPQGQSEMVRGGCVPDQKSPWVIPVVGASIGFVILVIMATCSYLIHERRKLEKLKQKYFKLHGGLLLFEEIKSNQGKSFTIFSEAELQTATNKFDKNQILGHGGHGTVYKGLLESNIEVAVKKCMTMDEQHKKEFGKEMLILSQINHINIVKLLGCCLEVQVPMLVYEFIPNGTLSNLIHGNHGQHISLVTRLQIAHESAEALAYLHSYASPPIIHGDVKSSNILLDVNLTAKVSDFGASLLDPIDKSQLVTLVQGTWGYLDPEYMQTCQLSDKSDVYSFGVVLLELLTRKNVFNPDAPEHEKSLSMRFLFAMKENKLEDILDDQISNNENMEVLHEVANLAKQCLAMCGEDRPSMKEVAEKLDRLIRVMEHPWEQQNHELESLLGESSYIIGSEAAIIGVVAAADVLTERPGCQTRCGDLDIPFPFGIGDQCAIHHGFTINCKNINGTSMAFKGDFEVTKISVPEAKAWMNMSISWQCKMKEWVDFQNFTYTPFRFSCEDNKIFVIGCNTMAYMRGVSVACPRAPMNNQKTVLALAQPVVRWMSCKAWAILMHFNKDYNTSEISYGNCGYVVIMEKAAFSYSTTYIHSTNFWDDYNGEVPAVMDWVININAWETCEEAKVNMSSYACVSNNSKCLNSTNGLGYRCKCSNGYKCSCPQGQSEPVQGVCVPDQKIQKPPWVIPVVGASIGFVMLVIMATFSYLIHERRKLEHLKQKYFKLHGGLLLFEEIKSNQGKSFTIFSEAELQRATNKFDQNQLFGHGGHGTVYKGLLESNIEVAVKKCMTMDEQHKKEFGKEMLILSQINHINIVKLLGCCLEVQVPMLVYEFIPNGTLSNLIHGIGNHGQHISLAIRLRISHESTEALAYLHSYASPPIIHGDVKSSNILLDVNLTAKVSDFGASILDPIDKSQLVTLVRDKSDVYGFGVVLLELLTRKNVFNLDAREHEKSLSMRFLSAMKENKLEDIMDDQISNNENMEVLQEVADLAKQCLAMCGEDRPSMKEVAEKLDRLIKVMEHPWEQQNHELESLLGESSYIISSEAASTRNFSIEKKPSAHHTIWPLMASRAHLLPPSSLLVLLLCLAVSAQAAAGDVPAPVVASRPGCPTKCGAVDIPFPFGIGDHCGIEAPHTRYPFKFDCLPVDGAPASLSSGVWR
uniref:Protein kinase domain-containing protein n=1 Tax=Leersia perrieri TaxID=77586 RepID=A0A0D9XEQ0_9ORYZ